MAILLREFITEANQEDSIGNSWTKPNREEKTRLFAHGYYGDAQPFAVDFQEGLPVNRSSHRCPHPCKYSPCNLGYTLPSK